MLDLLRQALAAERVVLSVMGLHAGEDPTTIFARKQANITACGHTLWLCRSPTARPDRTQAFFTRHDAFVLFLDPAARNGARPTTAAERAMEHSADRISWLPISHRLGPVTGNLSRGAYALMLSKLWVGSACADLWSYGVGEEPVRFKLGASTVLAERKDTSGCEGRARSRFRAVCAVGRLAAPFAVWVR